jgi:uncharacterized membrane protein
MMNWCIQNGIKTYEMGSTNYDPKKRLGFKFIPQYIYAKFRNPRFNFFTKYICELIKPVRYDPVLKELAKKNKKSGKKRPAINLVVLVIMCEAIDALAQILMKKGLPALSLVSFDVPVLSGFMKGAFASPLVWAGVVVYASNFFVWIFILAQVELSTAVPLTSINYVVLPVLTFFILHEKISLLRWVGIFFVSMGIYLVARTIGQKKGDVSA